MKSMFAICLFLAVNLSVNAQAPVSSAKDKTQYDPKEAFLNVSYKLKEGKMIVLINDVPYYVETISSSIGTDMYKIFSLDGKTALASYTVVKDKPTVNFMVTANGSQYQKLDFTEYLSKATSDLEKDAVKRKYPVYWLFKNEIK